MLRIAFEGEPLDRTLARVAAGVGPRIVQSDRELAATRDTLSAYFEGEDDEAGALPVDLSLVAGPFRRTVLDPRRCTAGSTTARSSPTRSWPSRPATRAPCARGTACGATPSPSSYPATAVLPSPTRPGSATTAAVPSASGRLALEGATLEGA